MFLVVSQRKEFFRQWFQVLHRHGDAHHASAITEARQWLQDHQAGMVVLDFRLVQENAQTLIQDLHQQCGKARLVLGNTSFHPQQELAAIASGVVACCDSAMQADELERIVDTVLQGGVWVSRAAIPLLVTRLQQASARAGSDAGMSAAAPISFHELTERQREVAEMVARGANNKQIASTLNITDRTVKAHLTAIFEKLGVPDRLQLALYVNNRKSSA